MLCHLYSLTEFGRSVFPRGSYLAGHLEAAKEPGHFFGKGYMKIVFDRIGLPDADAQLDAKIVAARPQNVNKPGDIVGHGHAKRDLAEWMIPPLWPWKVLMLPARGPSPALKSEEVITLRLMEDVEVPQLRTDSSWSSPSSQWHYFGDADPYPRTQTQACVKPQDSTCAPRAQTHVYSTLRYLPPSMPSAEPAVRAVRVGTSVSKTAQGFPTDRVTLLALRSETIYPVTDYWVDGSVLLYILPNGTRASARLDDVDWQRTADLNYERGVRVTLRTGPHVF